MSPLDTLVARAIALGDGVSGESNTRVLTDNRAELARVLQICNACRYCEGFCAVFPAMTSRLSIARSDSDYLANLCHNCGACLHACQYAPPHPFAVNVPLATARVRVQTYMDYTWPAALAALYRRNGLALAMALSAGLILFLILAAIRNGSLWQAPVGGSFYSVFPHGLMVTLFLPAFAFALLALVIGVRRFWRAEDSPSASSPAIVEAVESALALKYLDGGHGEGCNEADDAYTLSRRRFHHLVFYGFMLCFAATVVAALYHYVLGLEAPYSYTSAPKMLGIPGGLALVLGTLGLFVLNLRRDPRHGDPNQKSMDRAFIALLFLTGLSGLLLMWLRATAAMPTLLCCHLGAVTALFVTLPYGKFVHGVFRGAALLKWAIEKRRPGARVLRDA